MLAAMLYPPKAERHFSLMANPDPDVRQLLADLRDFNKERRRKAVYKLGMAGGEAALQALILAVGNINEDLIVRARAAQMLAMLRSPRAVDALIDALHAPGYQTPRYAAQALGVIGDRRAIHALRSIADIHENEGARKAALEAIQRLEHPSSATELTALQPALEEI
jgi:HEAT repeat protein